MGKECQAGGKNTGFASIERHERKPPARVKFCSRGP